MRAAVTGGSGFVGSHVVDLLLARGYEVNCLMLPDESDTWLDGKPVRFFFGNVTDKKSLAPFLAGCHCIINIAGLTRAKSEEAFMAVNRDGAVNLVEAALSIPDGPRQIISMSSQAATGPSPVDSCSDEDDPLQPITPYGRSKAALEAALESYDRSGRMRCTFIRAPGVYGPRDRDFFQYFKLVQLGIRVIVGERKCMSFVYVKTLAAAIVDCVDNPAVFGQAFFIADESPYDWDQFSTMIEAALEKKAFRIHVSEGAVAALAAVSEAMKPFTKKPPLIDNSKLVEIRQSRWVVSTSKAERVLGFQPAIKTRDAIDETARWYKEQGWL